MIVLTNSLLRQIGTLKYFFTQLPFTLKFLYAAISMHTRADWLTYKHTHARKAVIRHH